MSWLGSAPIQANAAGPDDTLALTLPEPSGHYEGIPVYEAGQTYRGTLGYGMMTPGSQSVMILPAGLSWPADDGPIAVPSGNEAIAGIHKDGQVITFTWADPWPSGILQGVFGFDFRVDEVENSEIHDVVWSVGGEETDSGRIIVREPGDQFANVTDGFVKNLKDVQLGQHISVDAAGKVSIADAAFEVELPYTVEYRTTTDKPGLTIADTVEDRLTLVPGSGRITTIAWDENGLNRTETAGTFDVAEGKEFSHTLDVAANTIVRLGYSAKLDIAQRDRIVADLQAAYDAVASGEAGGDWGIEVTNLATNSDGGEDEAARWIKGGSVRGPWGPNLGAAFGKSVDIREVFTTWSDDDAKILAEAQPLTYTIVANLTQWGKGNNHGDVELANDVVISDTLPKHARWLSDDAGFLTLTNRSADPAAQVALTRIDLPEGADPVEVLRGAGEFHYILDGNRLHINVGKASNNYAVAVKAEVTNVAEEIWDQDFGYAEGREVTNRAAFHWDGNTVNRDAKTWFKQFHDPDEIEWEDKFDKRGPGSEIETVVGQSVDVAFKFVVAPGVGDVTKSTVTDYVDHNIFDVSEANLDEIRESLRGKLDGSLDLSGDDFDVVLGDDGDLAISLSEAGIQKVTESGRPVDGHFELDITLPTRVFEAKTTLDIVNEAAYTGTDTELRYVSSTEVTATTYGNELEVQKRVYGPQSDSFVPTLRVELEDGEIVRDEFVYRIRILPHGDFTSMVREIEDILPEELDFLGFVNDAEGEIVSTDSYTIPGSQIGVVYDEEANTITVNRGNLTRNSTLDLHFKVKVQEFTEDLGITNVVGPSTATIVPTNGFPLSIRKVDASDPENFITDRDARFTVYDESGETPVVEDVFVVDGQLRVMRDGGEKSLLVEEPGTYVVREIIPPYGYERTAQEFVVTVDEHGASNSVTIPNQPSMYAVGDYTWIDANRDGVQDEGEEVLPGVGVELFRIVDGEPVSAGRTTTDADGLYLFDNLRAGEYQIAFTLTDEQAARYVFTTEDTGADAADSDANRETGLTARFKLDTSNEAITKDYDDQPFRATEGIDPTWDAGVVTRSYAVGDYTWIDANRDGIQDADEEILAGVTVDLLDGDGNVVATTRTDENGLYLFDELEAGEYQLRFTLAGGLEDEYLFTGPLAGDVAADSDASVADDPAVGLSERFVLDGDNAQLVQDYDAQDFRATEGIDPTWDAGVVVKTYAVGDYVWIDANRDGIQDADEEILAGVTVELLDAEGEVVATTLTDDEGRYLFDELRAGDYGVRFTLTEEQAATYRFTSSDAGEDDALDSDADRITGRTVTFTLDDSNEALTKDYDRDVRATQGIDPTWDAGVVVKTYAVGDYVWIDANRDGIQDDDEEVLPGVKVELLDSEGEVVATTSTDDEGRYLFDGLEAGEYRIRFTLTDEQQEKYSFTSRDSGRDDARDSDADEEGFTITIVLGDDNPALTLDYDREFSATEGVDPTWDAGVVLKLTEPTPGGEEPSPSPTPDPDPTPDPTPTPEPEPTASPSPAPAKARPGLPSTGVTA